MSPTLIVLAGILLFNWLVPIPARSPASPEAATAVPTEAGSRSQAAAPITPGSTATAVPLAIIMDPTPTPLPTVPASAAITLLGPPADSLLPAGSDVVLYWTWPQPLPETQQFVVYLAHDGRETAVGALTEPNLGQSYRLTLPPDSLPATETITWFVQLQLSDSGDILTASQSRAFRQPAANN